MELNEEIHNILFGNCKTVRVIIFSLVEIDLPQQKPIKS